jgi:hypothetical protein
MTSHQHGTTGKRGVTRPMAVLNGDAHDHDRKCVCAPVRDKRRNPRTIWPAITTSIGRLPISKFLDSQFARP